MARLGNRCISFSPMRVMVWSIERWSKVRPFGVNVSQWTKRYTIFLKLWTWSGVLSSDMMRLMRWSMSCWNVNASNASTSCWPKYSNLVVPFIFNVTISRISKTSTNSKTLPVGPPNCWNSRSPEETTQLHQVIELVLAQRSTFLPLLEPVFPQFDAKFEFHIVLVEVATTHQAEQRMRVIRTQD